MENQRPLSPHLTIYKWQLTSILSILHRLTGMGLVVLTVGLVFWLFMLSQGEASYSLFMNLLNSWPLIGLLFLLRACLIYHFYNGIRHLCWDAGLGLEIGQVYKSGWLITGLTLFTLSVWELFL